jgi:hypothetical protein
MFEIRVFNNRGSLRFNEIFLNTIYLNVALIRLYLLSKPGKLIKFKAAYIQK